MFRTQPIPAEYLPSEDARPSLFYGLPELHYPASLNLCQELVDGALTRGYGERVAYYAENARITYAELHRQVCRLANGLRSVGIGLGDRVLLRLHDGPELVYALLALQRIGAIAVPTYTLLRSSEIVYRANDTEAVGMIVHTDLRSAVEEARPSCPQLQHIIVTPGGGGASTLAYADVVAGQAEACSAASTGRDDIAVLLYTSGTTGEPKGVILTHADLLANADCCTRYLLKLQPEDILAGPPALPFAMGTVFFVAFTLRSGSAAVLLRQKTPPGMLDAIQRHRVSVLVGVPTFYNMMVQTLGGVQYDLRSLRLCLCAGEPMPQAVFDQWRTATGSALFQIFGTTELSGVLGGHRSAAGLKPMSLGMALAGYHVVVRDPDSFQELPRNTAGLLTFVGPTGTKYWRKPEQQRKAIRQGWNVVPDIVTMDDDGYVHYVARADDIIISAGYNIPPAQVEDVLGQHPAVLEAACVGAPDPTGVRSAIVKAFVVLRSGFSASAEITAQLQQFVRDHAAPYMYPREIEFLSELPKTLTGKIRRSELKQQAWEKTASVQL